MSGDPFESIEAVKRACCRLQSAAGVGTGYLIGERLVATCEHVVKDLELGDEVKARFGNSSATPIVATVAQVAARADVALLELSDAVSDAVPLPLSSKPLMRQDFTAFGFPAFAEPLGVALAGLVTDRNAEIPGKLQGLALFSAMLGANPPTSVGGFSGSPVVIGGEVVGHISSVLGAGSAMRQPHLGYAYAVPATGVLTLCGTPPVVQPPSQPPTPEADIEKLTQKFSELQFAASGKDIRRVIERAKQDGTLTPELRLYAAEVLISFALPADALGVLDGMKGERAQELYALCLSLQGDYAGGLQYAPTMKASAEAQGIIGGMFKRRWLATNNPAHLRSAFTRYFQAYTALGLDHYPGVNAAACALYLHKPEQSQQIAKEIAQQLGNKARDKWEQASYGESLLLSGDLESAREAYQEAGNLLGVGTRNVAVMSAQARRNLRYLKLPSDALDDALPFVPRVAAFTGHRQGAKLAPENIPRIRKRLDEILADQQIQFGYCSAASGSDLLFIEAMLSREAEVHVFLPFPAEHFRKTSVGPEPEWEARFDAAMDTLGPRVQVLSNAVPAPDDSTPYVRCNYALQEAARQQAKLLSNTPLLVAVVAASAEQDERAPGGTADAVRAWLNLGESSVERIDPEIRMPA